ncbi:MAG: carbonic anhydrase family protein [Bacteroidetes bacterium]|nr:carbonic anhydrase family protein [Bacteroidota bacterium]
MKDRTKNTQAVMTPQAALKVLKDGNRRFATNSVHTKNWDEQVAATSEGQYPLATILHCIDSRVSAELLFDQGIGDIVSIRIAGNFVNDDILGSMEFACKLAGTPLLVVLGHTDCLAVKGACDHIRMGNLTGLIEKIQPAVVAVVEPTDNSERTSKNQEFVNEVSRKNVHMTLENIRSQSSILKEMEEKSEIVIVGAMYDVVSREVIFFDV